MDDLGVANFRTSLGFEGPDAGRTPIAGRTWACGCKGRSMTCLAQIRRVLGREFVGFLASNTSGRLILLGGIPSKKNASTRERLGAILPGTRLVQIPGTIWGKSGLKRREKKTVANGSVGVLVGLVLMILLTEDYSQDS